MINWKEYIESRTFIKYRCKFCRKWFDEIADIKVHLIKEHGVIDKIEIKSCIVCSNPFVPILECQIICGRKDCILSEDKTPLMEVQER